MADAAPADVGDVQQAVYAAKIEERPEVGDVFDDTFEYLTFFEAGEDLFALFGQVAFDEGFVADHGILNLLVDLDHFEFHHFADILVVIDHRFDIDLGAGQEGFQTAAIDDQAAFRFADNRTTDDRTVFERVDDAFPGAQDFGFLTLDEQLGFLAVFLAFHVHFHFIALFEIGRGSRNSLTGKSVHRFCS